MENQTNEAFNASTTSIFQPTNFSNETHSSAHIPNQEAYLAKIDNTMAAIQEQNLTNDPRYYQLNLLKNRLTGNYLLA